MNRLRQRVQQQVCAVDENCVVGNADDAGDAEVRDEEPGFIPILVQLFDPLFGALEFVVARFHPGFSPSSVVRTGEKQPSDSLAHSEPPQPVPLPRTLGTRRATAANDSADLR